MTGLLSSPLRPKSLRVEAHNFAINNRALYGQFCQGFLQGLQAKVALVSRSDLALAARAGLAGTG